MRFGREGIVLLVLIVAIIGFYLYRSKFEGFDAQATADHNTYVQTQQGTRNDLGFGLTTANAQGNLGTDTQPLFGTTTLVGSGEAVPSTTVSNPYPLNDGKQGLFGKIKMCEDVATADPNSFDTAEFAKDCGVCFDIGTDSNNKPKTGGLLVLEPEKQYARKYLKRGNRIPEYKPTFGSCPAGRLATNKEEAQRIQNDLACQKSKDFNLPGCSQCYSDGNFYTVDQAVITETGIVFDGAGKYTITTPREQKKGTMGFSQKPMAQFGHFSEALKEGETINIRVEQLDDTSVPIRCMLYGVLSGFTSKGRFDIDLRRLVQADNVTKSKVRTRGINSMTSPPSTIMIPGAGQKSMDLQIVIPFSFTEDDTLESDNCPDGPFVVKQASAEFLESDPCYKKGSKPGAYSQECLTGLFIANGCTDKGTGYPSSQRPMTDLMYASNNQARPLADIANYIYDQAVRAAMGMSQSGQKLSITEWSASSVFCTGKVITSVCDLPGNDVGPVSFDCLKYLWNNEGSGKPTGDTYLITSSAQSMQPSSSTPLFCTGEGTASPVKPDGTPNPAAVEMYQKLGGLEAVRSAMREIHRKANDNQLLEDVKKEAILQCYGKTPAAPPLPTGAKPETLCKPACGVKARTVKIFQRREWMNFAEVVVRDTDGRNVSLGKPTKASSLYPWDGAISKASNAVSGVEGSRNYYSPPYIMHGGQDGNNRDGDTWEVDLGREYEISSVTIYNRDDCCWYRMQYAILYLIAENGNVVKQQNLQGLKIQTVHFGTDSRDCVSCLTPNRNEVFLVGKEGVAHVKEEGSTICQAVGARQATYQELQEAQAAGADTCEAGFVSDSNDLVNPISLQNRHCGSPGIKNQVPQTNDEWVFIANENGTGTVPFDTQVRYGKFGVWVYRDVKAGNVPATNANFGDPYPGVYKELNYKKPATKLTGKIWCYGPKPAMATRIEGGRSGTNRPGGTTYNVTNFSPSAYGRPAATPGMSV